jgi:hypothetical protein
MSSNNPYGAEWSEGGPQPPIPGRRARSEPQSAPYGYPQQEGAGYPQQPAAGDPDTGSGYAFGPFAPDDQQTRWAGARQGDPYGASEGQYGRGEPYGPGGPYGSGNQYGSGDQYGPGDQYGAGDQYGTGPMQPSPPSNDKTKILIIIGAAALAVLLIAIIAVVVATRDTSSPDPQGGQGSQQTNPSQSGAPQQASRPSDAVTAYLQALATGDATTALSYAADPAPTGRLLTTEVLTQSLKRAPLTDIDVPVVEDQNAKSVSARYTLGKSDVSESFDVVKVGDIWKISRAVKDLDISYIVDGSVPVKINGVKVSEKSVAVLPGSYAFTTGLSYVGYGSKNVVLVKSPYVEADTYQIQSQLTKTGKKAVISATKRSFNKCLQQHSLSPSNCPQKFNSKYSYKKGTITWTQASGDPFRKAKVALSGTQARVEVPINLKLSGSCTYQGRSGNCSGTLTGKSVAVAKVTSKPLKVKWS